MLQPLNSALRRLLAAATALVAVLIARPGFAAPPAARPAPAPRAATEPAVRPSLLWALIQLVPSPELWVDSSGARLGARWQVTPLLYSFGINRKLSPWRTLVAEPLVRHAGSIELFASPEYVALTPSFQDNWLLRGGLRAYFPLVQRGDYLSCSLGGSAVYVLGQPAASYEAGLYTLFGVFGAQITYTPTPAVRSATLTLSIHYF